MHGVILSAAIIATLSAIPAHAAQRWDGDAREARAEYAEEVRELQRDFRQGRITRGEYLRELAEERRELAEEMREARFDNDDYDDDDRFDDDRDEDERGDWDDDD